MIKRAIERLQQQQKEQIMQMYQLFDNKNKGYIDADAIVQAMKSLGYAIDRNQISQMIKNIDSDRNAISKQAFKTLMTFRLDIKDDPSQHQAAFNYFDNGGRNKILLKDLQRVAQQLGEDISKCPKILFQADKDQDGNIDYQQFKRVIKKTSYNI